MNPSLALRLIIDPTLDWMQHDMGIRSGAAARAMLLAAGGQESGWRYRAQVPVAHAMGWWQFERGGGVAGVLAHRATKSAAISACAALGIAPTAAAVHPALQNCDILACVFARLLLLSDPKPLPMEPGEGWAYYLRTWRPGKPHPQVWPGHWRAGLEAMVSEPRSLADALA